jgi:hypothetical protein
MQISLYGIHLIAPQVVFHLGTPWRCMAMEHRLFDAVRQIPDTEFEQTQTELTVTLTQQPQWEQARKTIERILKGWQEEASDAGNERRSWFWLLESDTDSHGYDHNGDDAMIYCYLRLMTEAGGDINDESAKTDMIDLQGFGFRLPRNVE